MGGAAANMLREFGGTLAVAAWKHSAAAARATTNSPGSKFGEHLRQWYGSIQLQRRGA